MGGVNYFIEYGFFFNENLNKFAQSQEKIAFWNKSTPLNVVHYSLEKSYFHEIYVMLYSEHVPILGECANLT